MLKKNCVTSDYNWKYQGKNFLKIIFLSPEKVKNNDITENK